MSIFPERAQGRLIPLDKLPKYYMKEGKVYETRTNKLIKNYDTITN